MGLLEVSNLLDNYGCIGIPETEIKFFTRDQRHHVSVSVKPTPATSMCVSEYIFVFNFTCYILHTIFVYGY